MRAPSHLPRVTLALLIAAIGAPASAAQMNFVQYPAGTAYKAPIPNVILSVDTSGSMAFCDVSGTCTTSKQRLTYVKQGLQATLIDSTKYDEQFRLSWQSFACDSIPSSRGNCSSDNSIAKFSGAHKTNFKSWVSNLTATGSTPSHNLVYSAGEYLKTTGKDSPWNAVPGTADSAPLACRRAYHIFLTDGGWNFSYGSITSAFKNAMKLPNASATIPVQNIDSRAATFPDGKSYSDSSAQTRIYRDDHKNQTRITTSNRVNTYYAYPTLAELAFNYWSTDLQPGINNELKAKIRKTGQETFTSGSRSVMFDEYWNPRNDPASWQHLVQYTIGYGASAGTLKKNNPTSPQFTGGVFGMYDIGFASLATGATTWDNVASEDADGDYDDYRPQEMWHMAVNSRGKFYPVAGGDLSGVFADIFDDIIVDTTAPVSGTTSESRSVSRVGTQSYQTNYIAADDANSLDNRWYGYVTSSAIATDGTTKPNLDWGVVDTRSVTSADKLDARTDIAQRLIVSYDIQKTANKGISFKWANLSTAATNPTPTAASVKMWLQKGTIGSTTTFNGDGRGEDRLNFIRGDRTKEQKTGNTGATFRNRKSRQGDIVNSAIWYTGTPTNGHAATSYRTFAADHRARLPMLYVGGNDGMLHGFSAEDGSEKLAYIPHGVLQNLAKLTDRVDPVYTHQYYVDGSPFTGDVDIGTTSPQWRTYLAGTLGAGGRGYFVLDVTKPGSAKEKSGVSNEFTEANAANLVVLDKTAAAVGDALPSGGKPVDPNAHADIGHIMGTPVVSESNQQRALQITRTNNNRWALILGNGYNSLNERPVLLIQYLDGTKELKTIPAVATTSAEAVANGLSTPQFLDVNSDGAPDYVYAGDLRGNLWKFDISSADATRWGVAFDGNPLFTANYSASAGNSSRQPITVPPVVRPNRIVGGLMVAFGTGQSLTEEDRADRAVQTIYSVLDNTRYAIVATGTDKGKVTIDASNPVPATVSGRSSLVSLGVSASSLTPGTDEASSRSFWQFTGAVAGTERASTEVNYKCEATATNCTVKKGWYMDLPVTGERVTTNLDYYDGSGLLEIISEVPASGSATAAGEEICAPTPQSAKPFRTLINIATGRAPSVGVMYMGKDMGYGLHFSRMTASSKELRVSTKGEQIRIGNDGKRDRLARLPEVLIRPNWRQLK
ncbi:PilC/PilY family type IV pilus protein [Acidovorax sp. CCYZU-2555]|uniref:pilus assembly protein n=1 Tax=Acidovorax sp. CCYZU-2555 TaxID=2835042 RepID=UPI001BCD6DF2|nr:PilC/PilY family type IV pilus protein [Acidovorax sp. CCYZU-2555]MBS7776625.1 hypothetical protein [Acidovorax sp. CCYZU-2555]